MARGDQALRQWKILTTIMAHPRYGVSQKTLLDEIGELVPRGKGRRTLQRDLLVLEQAGFPLDRSGRTPKGTIQYKLLPGLQQVPPILPTVEELISLIMAQSVLSMFEGTPFKDNLERFIQKVQVIFPEEARKDLEDAQSLFGTLDRPSMDFAHFKAHITELNQVIKARRQMKMTYFSRRQGKDAEYLIDPMMVFTYGRLLYLVAYVHEYKEVRQFSLEKIKKLIRTENTFKPRKYSLEGHRNEAFGIIREEPFELVVRFDKSIASYVKRRNHHPSQKIKTLPNGDIELSLKAGGWDEMETWILSYSDRAEVIKPKRMRTEIKKRLKKALGRYGPG